jgi:flavin reductase (DIM6/NTAB) family NADH-FMN oxidoreductase RutF
VVVDSLKSAFAQFATGVAVVTARSGPDRIGLTITSFNTVSIDPPLILFSVDSRRACLPVLRDTAHFAVNVLSSEQHHVSDAFARYQSDQWRRVQTSPGLGDTPLVSGALAHFECAPYAEYDGGDHVIIVGRVVRSRVVESGSPLLFFRRGYRQLVLDGEAAGAGPSTGGVQQAQAQ